MASIQSSPLDTMQIALGDVFARAGSMVRRLSQSNVTSGTVVPEVMQFQVTWNTHLEAINAWLVEVDFTPEGISVEVLTQGLKEDGKYGMRTAYALVVLLFSAGLPENAAASLPTSPGGIPVWYAQHHSHVEGALIAAATHLSTPPDPVVVTSAQAESVVDASETVMDQVLPPGSASNLSVDDSGSEFVFDDDTIVSSAGRTSWSVPLWALGLGVATTGVLIFAVVRRAKKSARIPA